MNWSYTQLNSKWQALVSRERLMLFVGGLSLLYALLNSLMLAPVHHKSLQVKAEIAESQASLATLQQQMADGMQQAKNDPDAALKQKITDLQNKIAQQSAQISAMQGTLVTPADMSDLLKSLLAQHAKVRLMEMTSQPPKDYLADELAALKPADSTKTLIYKHTVQIKLVGNYLDLMAYVEDLQHLSKQLLWEKAELTTKVYPVSELTIDVYTLSMDKKWLQI